MKKEILIFIGHSDDAKSEVESIVDLEQEFQKYLRRLVKNNNNFSSSLKLFAWENDANLGVGGQNFAIHPFLENADIALFIFKERIGKVTWEELDFCRTNKIKTIAIFPSSHPEPEKLNSEDKIDEWRNLIRKKKLLIEDWNSDNSLSITPVEPYSSIQDLLKITTEKIFDVLPDIIHSQSEKLKDSTEIKKGYESQVFNLDNYSSSLEYLEKNVKQYRSLLREEFKEDELDSFSFLKKNGYIVNNTLTYVGILLFAERPSKHIPSAICRTTKYEGATKSSSRKRLDIDNSIVNQILLTREFLEENLESRDIITNRSSSSDKDFRFPMKCLREVIANAFCHRNYSDKSRIVYLSIFNNRIEISNPGKWGSKDISDGENRLFTELIGKPVEKNLSLTRAISAINFMEMEGSGIQTAIDDCNNISAPIPNVTFQDGYITVTVYPRTDWTVNSLSTRDYSNLPEGFKVDSKELNKALDTHLQYIANWSSDVSFKDMSSTKNISKVFVELSYYSIPISLQFDKNKDKRIGNLDEILVEDNIILLGQPGSGKTTAMKMLVNNFLANEDSNSSFKIPIVIRLREIQATNFYNLYALLADIIGLSLTIKKTKVNFSSITTLNKTQSDQLRSIVCGLLDELEILLILDGFDELDLKIREKIIGDIQEIGDSVDKSKLILTSRSGDFSYSMRGFKTLEITPFHESQIRDFSQKWLGNKSESFMEEIQRMPFYDSTIRPITLAHLAVIFERYGSLPEKPKTIYRKIVNLLLEEWDSQRRIQRQSKYGRFSVDRKLDFLSSFSFYLTTDIKKSVFSLADFKTIYRRIHVNFNLPDNEENYVVNELETHTGLLINSSYETYEFVHKSIQEYLCAEYLVKLPTLPDTSYLASIPNELAIAVSISSNSDIYFVKIIEAGFENLEENFILTFLNRLMIEKPDFLNKIEIKTILFSVLSDHNIHQGHTDNLNDLVRKFITSFQLNSQQDRFEQIYSVQEDLESLDLDINIPSEELDKYCAFVLKSNNNVVPSVIEKWPALIVLKKPITNDKLNEHTEPSTNFKDKN